MCLLKSESAARTSSLPVKVYKVLLSNNCSPFQYQKYHHGINKPRIAIQPPLFKEDDNVIEDGYLHAYTSWDTAARVLHDYAQHTSHGVKITEMYIPPETEYWLGAADEIAAKELDWPENAEEWCAGLWDYPPIASYL